MTLFFRLLDVSVDEKAHVLKSVIREGFAESRCVERDAKAFTEIPGSPFAYWVSDSLRHVFRKLEPFEAADRSVRQGLATTDDFRFVRTWWEVDEQQIGNRWWNFAKGGNFSPFYADLGLVLQWEDSGAMLKAKVIAEYGNAGKRIYNEDYYFRAGITWPLRAHRFAPQALPAGCICSVRGYAAFTPKEMLLSTLAVFNSSCFDFLFKTFLGRFGYPEFVVGILQKMPWARLSTTFQQSMSDLAHRAWSLRRSLDTMNETSHAFLLPAGTEAKVAVHDRGAVEEELRTIQQAIDNAVFSLYEVDAADRAAIEASSNRVAVTAVDLTEENRDNEETADDDTLVAAGGDALVSWLVGVAFGRFDFRIATGERGIPVEPDPFERLPARSPGMYIVDANAIDCPDVFVDDEGHASDLAAQVRRCSEWVCVDTPSNLRSWLAREFFPLHIRIYSRSRRKAPIYWQLATPSASYSIWLYIHAFSKDTLFRVQNDYVAPKRSHEERRLEELTSETPEKGTAAQRKELSAQEAFVGELRAFLDEIKRVAPLWNPNLDDGVIINFAPLWRLVPHHKPWQKELKATWDALCDGKYDWAHLAMHLWPERVVPKCVTDRSLAIAHGLEDVFWIEGSDGKWIARDEPTQSAENFIRERTSPAVKAALKSLLDAPQPTGTGRKSKRG